MFLRNHENEMTDEARLGKRIVLKSVLYPGHSLFHEFCFLFLQDFSGSFGIVEEFIDLFDVVL